MLRNRSLSMNDIRKVGGGFGEIKSVKLKDNSFYTEWTQEPVYLHLMPVRLPDFTRLMTRGMFVNRLMWFKSQHRLKVKNNVIGIHFVGKPRKIFPRGVTMEKVVDFYFEMEDVSSGGDSTLDNFYSELIREDLVRIGKRVENIIDIKRECRKSNFARDLGKEAKFRMLVNIVRLKNEGIILGYLDRGIRNNGPLLQAP